MTRDAINAIAERGREIYETQIRPQVEADHHGDFLMINSRYADMFVSLSVWSS